MKVFDFSMIFPSPKTFEMVEYLKDARKIKHLRPVSHYKTFISLSASDKT